MYFSHYYLYKFVVLLYELLFRIYFADFKENRKRGRI